MWSESIIHTYLVLFGLKTATLHILLSPCKVTGFSYKSQPKRTQPVGKYHKAHGAVEGESGLAVRQL